MEIQVVFDKVFDIPDPFAPPVRRDKAVRKDKRRSFTTSMKNEILHRQNGKCAKCRKRLDPRATQFDHKKQHSLGGKTSVGNGRALCSNCHSKATHKSNVKKVNRRKIAKKPRQNDPFDVRIPTIRIPRIY